MALVDDLRGVLLVLSLAREGELVLGLAIRDLVNAVDMESPKSTILWTRVN